MSLDGSTKISEIFGRSPTCTKVDQHLLMLLREIQRTATLAWSPIQQHGSLFATGTIAGTMSLDFDPTGTLEIFSLNQDEQQTLPLGIVKTPDRLHKLVWSSVGPTDYGILVGGLANGSLQIWDPEKILKSEYGYTREDDDIHQTERRL